MTETSPAPDPRSPLTVRLEPDRAVCSDDQGMTWLRTAPTEALVAAVTAAGWTPVGPAAPTAASLGMLAEARNARPVEEAPQAHPSRRPAATSITSPAAIRVADTLPSRPLADVLAARRTRRRLHSPVPLRMVSSLLARVLTTSGFDTTSPLPKAFARLPSAGGRRPVRVALLALNVDELPRDSVWGLDPNASILRPVQATASDARTHEAAAVAAGNLHAPPAALLVLLADFARTTSRYPAGAALVWRDAGVVLGGLSLTAEDLGLGACPLGTSGTTRPELAASAYTATGATPHDTIHEVGMLALGSAPGLPQ